MAVIGSPAKVRFGWFEFDFALHELRRRGLRVRLSASQLRLLTLFLERPGELITREEIVGRLWTDPQNIDVSNGVNTAINRLRKSLNDDPAKPDYLETVIGIGYRFVAKVEARGAASNAGSARRAVDSAAAPPAARHSATPAMAAAPTPFLPPPMEAGPPPEPTTAAGTEPAESLPEPETAPARPFWLRHRWKVAAIVLAVLSAAAVVASRQSSRELARLAVPVIPYNFKRITYNDSDDNVTAAAMSPSGEMIAYSDRSGISVVWPDSRATRLLASPPHFEAGRIDWYPDGKRLAVSGSFKGSKQSQVWQVAMDGAAPKLLMDDAAGAAISPDGRRIAFTRNGGAEIDIANADGGSAKRLAAADKQTFRFLLWSRSGAYLIVESSNDAPPEGLEAPVSRSVFPLADLEARSQWSYETLDAASGKSLDREANVRFDTGYLLKDGRLFYAQSSMDNVVSSTRLMMARTDPATGRFLSPPERALTLYGDQAKGFTSSANGKQIAIVLNRSTADIFVGKLRRKDFALDGITKLTHHSVESYPHDWTPKDDAVLLENNNFGKDAVFEQPVDGSPGRLMAQLAGDAALPEFTPDGKWILFLEFGGHPNHADAVFRVPAAGGAPEQVPTKGEIDDFQCSTGAKGLCVLRQSVAKKERIYFALDPLKGMGRELARTPWEPGLLGDWSVSPDGSALAIANHDPLHPSIRLISLTPTKLKTGEIPVEGFGALLAARWDVDGRGFFVESRKEAAYNLVYVDREGRAGLLRQSATPIWGIPSHDGAKLAFPEVTFRSNVLSQTVSY